MPHPPQPDPDALEAARLFAALHKGTPGDVAFYLRVARGADRVLELGVGTGRVSAPLAAAGHVVTGVDVDLAHLSLARAAIADRAAPPVTLLAGDMARLDGLSLEAPFDRIFIPFTGLFALPSHAAMQACFTGARAVLADDGLMAFDVYPVDDDDCAGQEPEETGWDTIGQIRWDGHDVTVSENDIYPGEPCRVDTLYRYELAGDRVLEQRIAHCFASPAMLVSMLMVGGFTTVELYGDFEGNAYDDASERLIVVAAPL